MLNIEHFRNHLPPDWGDVDFSREYELEEIPNNSPLFLDLNAKAEGSFNLGTEKIVRIKNPSLYLSYSLYKEMYEKEGGRVLELFHCTAQRNVESIAARNLDYRCVRQERARYGQGVSFTPDSSYAHQHSTFCNGTERAMIIADVLVNRSHKVTSLYSTVVPDIGYDTTHGNNQQVVVKYFDNEFYPKYVVYYTCNCTRY